MYRIIGSDQKEYGPIPATQIRQWITEARLNRLTRVKVEGETEWKTLGALPEFDDAFGILPTAPKPSGPPQHCSLTTGALICGALGVVTCITAPVGLVLGLLGHSRIRQSNGQLTGSGFATAGILLSILAMFLWVIGIFASLMLPALGRAKLNAMEKTQTIQCVNNMKQLGLAVRMYSLDHEDHYPTATNWCSLIQADVMSPKPFQCPLHPERRCAFAFNEKLSGLADTNFSPNTVMIFESELGWNGAGGAEQLKSHGHPKYLIVTADGSVLQIEKSKLDTLRWEP